MLQTDTIGTDPAPDPAPLVAQCRRLACEFPPLVPSRRDTPDTQARAIADLRRWERLCGPLPD
jgi:hypothetical protein